IIQRVHGVQTTVIMVTVFTLVFVALFTERRHSEETIKQSKDRLQLALDGAELGAFSANLITGQFECDVRTALIHGDHVPPTTIKEGRRYVHPVDLVRMNKALKEASRTGGSWNAEYRVVHAPGQAHAGKTRWATLEGSILRDSQGTPVGLLGVTRDVTVRKRIENALAERNAQLGMAGRAALVGSYTYDVNKGTMQISEGYAAIHGLPLGTTEASYNEWRTRVHPDDLKMAEGTRDRAFANGWKEDNAEYRIVLATGEVRWIERRGWISYGKNGRAERVVGVNIDVTARKRAEERQHVLLA